ncbi:MAG TPA: ABC transporter ATP-binding protein [Acidimicrobiia bacterium]|nr:ABC transporter ATP-binding protein [Acidimicrobiia bacterium]
MSAAITVDDVSKVYRLYHERNQSLKAAIMRRARVRYEEFWALRDVSFDVPEGATFALIGENGSGKSTLLKCMAHILRPEKGRIQTNGKISALLELGAGFHPELTGRENIFLNGSILGMSKKQLNQRFDEIVDFAGLEHFIDTPVKNYSSGMYVRLGFSVAINVDPDILLIDEVLAVGDAEFQRRCLEKFDDFRAAGKTIVIVSHALESIRNLCDTATWLEHGATRRTGVASEVIDEYLTDTHIDRAADGDFGTRWGSGEGRLEKVELLDVSEQPVKRVRTGDTVILRFHYKADEVIPKPIFGLAIYTLDGVRVTGPSTRDGNLGPDELPAGSEGYIDLRVEKLLLLPGTYDISASLHNTAGTHVWDMRHRLMRFDVEFGEPREEYGFTSLGGNWEGDVLDGGR